MQRNLLAGVMLTFMLAGCVAGGASPGLKRGWELMVAEDYVAAIDQYEILLKEHPDNPYALLNLGVAYQRLGNFDRARPNYQAAIVHGGSAEVTRVAETEGIKTQTTTVAELARQNLEALPN
jgi:tetratricopeptide (TPR) repeat protein